MLRSRGPLLLIKSFAIMTSLESSTFVADLSFSKGGIDFAILFFVIQCAFSEQFGGNFFKR